MADPASRDATLPMPTIEYGVRCADGTPWEDTYADLGAAMDSVQRYGARCGCEQPGHVIQSRVISPWRDLTPPARHTTVDATSQATTEPLGASRYPQSVADVYSDLCPQCRSRRPQAATYPWCGHDCENAWNDEPAPRDRPVAGGAA